MTSLRQCTGAHERAAVSSSRPRTTPRNTDTELAICFLFVLVEEKEQEGDDKKLQLSELDVYLPNVQLVVV